MSLRGIGGAPVETKFVIEVTIDDTDASGNRDFQFYSQGALGLQNYNIDWGDGNSDTGITATNITHTYSANGVYDIKIDGRFGINFYAVINDLKRKITKLKNWGTDEAQLLSLYNAFYGCSNMTYEATDYPDVTNLDVGNHTKMQSTFRNCEAFTVLDLSNWQNLDQFTTMYGVFNACFNLTSLNLNNWDTSNVVDIRYIFNQVGTISKNCVLTAQNWDLTSLLGTGTQYMFHFAEFSSIDLTGWTFNPATNHNFFRCFYQSHIPTIDLSGWVDCSIGQGSEMFRNMDDTTSLNISGINTANNTSYNRFLNNCILLTQIDGLDELESNSTTLLSYSFYNLYSYDWSNENLSNAFGSNSGLNTSMNSTFFNVGLTNPTPAPNVSTLDTSSVTTFTNCWRQAKLTTNPDMSNWDMSSAIVLQEMIRDSDGITSIDATNWGITSSVTTFNSFARYSELEDITFGSGSDFSGVTHFGSTFYQCNNLTSIDFPTNADFSSVTTMTNFMSNTLANMSVAEYDNFLLRFDATNSNSGITLSFGKCQYTGGGAVATAHASIIAKGNTIIDDGVA